MPSQYRGNPKDHLALQELLCQVRGSNMHMRFRGVGSTGDMRRLLHALCGERGSCTRGLERTTGQCCKHPVAGARVILVERAQLGHRVCRGCRHLRCI